MIVKKHLIVILLLLIFTLFAYFLYNKCSNSHVIKEEEKRIQDSIDRENIRYNDSIKYVNDSIELVKDSIKQAERINLLKHSVKITSAWLSNPNSAGGVDANIYYRNLSDKTIKYLIWTGYPINAVGDRVGCEIRGFEDFRGKDTGPVKPGHSGGGCWGCAWYNYSAKKLIITKIEIIYMDNSSLEIQESELSYVLK